MIQVNKINRLMRLIMVFLYLAAAVAIWWLPMLAGVSSTQKIILSSLLALYSVYRFYRLTRPQPKTEDNL